MVIFPNLTGMVKQILIFEFESLVTSRESVRHGRIVSITLDILEIQRSD